MIIDLPICNEESEASTCEQKSSKLISEVNFEWLVASFVVNF